MDEQEYNSFYKINIKKKGFKREDLINALWEIQKTFSFIPKKFIVSLGIDFHLSVEEIEEIITSYHFLSLDYRGKNTIYLENSVSASMNGRDEILRVFKNELGIELGEVSKDGLFGLYETSCLGMADQGPSAFINEKIFTRLNPSKVKILIQKLKNDDLRYNYSSEVSNKVQLEGPLFFNSDFILGDALKKSLKMSSEDIRECIFQSQLRGRGGAGFSTGIKWKLACKHKGPRYLFANADEGEPGTFKDRALLTLRANQIFEGMIISARAIEAKKGYLYLRAEYFYLKDFLEKILFDLRKKNYLGKKILGSSFSFDIFIKMGAGAYICGEESALIESSEGKRAAPRNRPPFPVESGYLGKPTVVNNLETLAAVPMILIKGVDWFLSKGTKDSKGLKLLSISGDCELPGIYEVEFGTSLKQILELVKASNVFAVQIGGPSGKLVSQKDFDKKIAYEELSTGGAIMIFSKDILSIVKNHVDFFVRESCGLCIPCRAGNVILQRTLDKIIKNRGVPKDLEILKDAGNLMKKTSRCGLGITSPHPVLDTFEDFSEIYKNKIHWEKNFVPSFNFDGVS